VTPIWSAGISSDADHRQAGCHVGRGKVRSKDLAEAIGITEPKLSLLKSGKVRGVRFATLEAPCSYPG
jgi:hypothetical protein